MAKRIVTYLREIEHLDDPKQRGKELTGNLAGLWRYRVGDYRVICDIANERVTVYVLRVGHRKQIY